MKTTFLLRHQRGLSIVELLVGVAIGLFILTGALKLFSDYINNNRRLTLETRVNQDLRAAVDLISRDLRRAGFWGNSISGVVTTNSQPVAATSPYSAVSPIGTASAPSTTSIYSYSQDIENNTLDDNENFGFRLNSGVLQYQKSKDNWQAITDSNTLIVTVFTITPAPVLSCIRLDQYCTNSSATCATCALDTNGCPTTTCNTCPFIKVRSYEIALQGTSTTDASVMRGVQETVRVRNDQLLGSCPL